ncbi:MAG5620 family putative phospho-sugar mutase [Mycoplasma sp. 21DD0573]|uniref:MAG5620 family putative phospho-sugar mutase n=1 Tax=unclassified Mycoplasma TaxID=2683645 RepID=UPI002B1D5BC4|nr:hypothetical protein [Mycoplasma sp. 21DD0573]MEA4276299.1 hypothetical protein [Mycoplasma sp. 21DD0573]
MSQINNKITHWFNFYKSKELINSDINEFVRKVDNQFPNGEFYTRAKSTVYGIEFDTQNQLGYNNLNPYTLLNLISLFDKSLPRKSIFNRRRKVLVALKNKVNINSKLQNLLIRFLNDKKYHVYTFNIDKLNDFFINTSVNNMDLDYSVYLDYKETNNKFYLKIYNKNKLISLEEQEKLINELYEVKDHIFVSDSNYSIVLNSDKVIDSAYENFLKSVKYEFDFSSNNKLVVYTLISDNLSNYIINRFLSNLNVKVSKLNPTLNKDLKNKNSTFSIVKWALSTNYNANLIIVMDEHNDIKLFARVKNSFVELNNDQIAYLFISNQYLKWKETKLTDKPNIFIPLDASELIINLLNTFKIPYEFENKMYDPNNILFAYNSNSFSNDINEHLSFENYDFLFNFCVMLQEYLENNNLLTLKYNKMIESMNKTYYVYSYINKTVQDMKNVFDYLVNKPTGFLKKSKIDKLQLLDWDNTKQHYIFQVKTKGKRFSTITSVSYKKAKKEIEIKTEFQSHMYKFHPFLETIWANLVKNKIRKRILKIVKQINKLQEKKV